MKKERINHEQINGVSSYSFEACAFRIISYNLIRTLIALVKKNKTVKKRTLENLTYLPQTTKRYDLMQTEMFIIQRYKSIRKNLKQQKVSREIHVGKDSQNHAGLIYV